MHRRIEDLEDKLKEAEMSARIAADDLNSKLLNKTTEYNTAKLENDRLKVKGQVQI